MTATKLSVTYVNHMGNDKTVVNAARASFNKQDASENITDKDKNLLKFLARGYKSDAWEDLAHRICHISDIAEAKELMWELRTKAVHFAPFAHPQISLRISAPLAIARQLWKAHIGAVGGDAGYAAWSEESRRYLDDEPAVYIPDAWRKSAEDVKQGSSSETLDINPDIYSGVLVNAKWAYRNLLDAGVAPEQARFFQLNSTVTTWTWTGSLMFFARVCHQRLDGDAQYEARILADQMAKIIAGLFPYSWEALLTGDIKAGMEDL